MPLEGLCILLMQQDSRRHSQEADWDWDDVQHRQVNR